MSNYEIEVLKDGVYSVVQTQITQEIEVIIGPSSTGGGGGGTGLTTEQVQDIVAGMLVAGSNVTLTYDDVGNKLTITSGGSSGLTTEEVQDIVAGMLTAGSNITLTYDDVGNKLTVTAAGGGISSIPTSYPQTVIVSTGSESRPTGSAVVIWVGGDTQPTNMTSADVWLSGATVTAPSDTTAPTVPTGLVSSAITQTSFTVSWTASTDAVGVTAYDVAINGTVVGSTASTTYNVTGRTAGTTYNVTVRARDAAGNASAYSTALPVTTTASADTTAPTVPTGLASSAITQTSFTVSWSPSTDAVGVASYDVAVDGVIFGNAASTSLSITGRTAGTTYSVTVRAKDAAGNTSAYSTALPVTTSAASAGTASIFGASSPGGTPVAYSDGTSAMKVGNRFYATRSLTVTGARLWIPAAATGAFLTDDITFYAYTQDWTGGSLAFDITALSPARTKTVSGPRTAGAWTEATFDTPLTINAVNSGASGADTVAILYSFASGSRYIVTTLTNSDPIPSASDSTVYLSESNFNRAATADLSPAGTLYYCTDLIFQEV